MASPEWFFSTLAQASASIVGFVVALGAVLYSLERQRRSSRSDRLREALIGLRRRYHRVVRAISIAAHRGGVTTRPYLTQLHFDTEEIQEKIAEDPDQRGKMAPLVWTHTHRILELLERIGPERDYLLTGDALDALRESTGWLRSCIDVAGDRWKEFYRDLTGELRSAEVGYADYRQDILEAGDRSDPGTLIERWIKHESGGDHREWAGHAPDDSGLTGQNMFSLATVFQYLSYDVDEVEARRVDTLVDFDPNITRIVIGVALMTAVGVFIPSLLLVASPTPWWPVLDGWALVSTELSLLVLTGVSLGWLLWVIWQSIHENIRIPEAE